MSFGERLRAIRKAKRLTQKQIAAGTGKTERYYQAVEYDKVNPGFDFVLALADFFSLGLDELVGREAIPSGLETKIPAAEKRSLVYVSIAGHGDDIRNEIISSLLETDCLVAGMLDSSSQVCDNLKLIEHAIDDSDYYVLIVHRGGIHPPDLPLTAEEVRMAVRLDKPRSSFVYYSCVYDEVLSQLGQDAASFGPCQTWRTAEELGNAVSRSVSRLRKNRPTKGWMRGDEITKEQLMTENGLRMRIDELEKRLREASS
jgi:transcriptional regulator with XRE-family HTH domain